MNAFVKQFQSVGAAVEEQLGYSFFQVYCQRAPKLLAINPLNAQVSYENIAHNTDVVTDVINRDERVDLRDLFHEFATLSNTHASVRTSEAGTQKFFIERLGRLNADLVETYQAWLLQHPTTTVQAIEIPTRSDLVASVRRLVGQFDEGICAPSQGDLHERNIFADGTIVDFEAAGWNLLATDIATFLWHSLFAGNYFGPRYARWSTDEDKKWLKEHSLSIASSQGGVVVSLSPARSDFIKQYLESFVYQLACLDAIVQRQISVAICFRLLTTFPIHGMSKEDQHLSFALANYFFSTPFPKSIEELL